MNRSTEYIFYLALSAMLVCACSAEPGQVPCTADEDCPSGTLCASAVARCVPAADHVPAVEVWPPNQNDQGWVAQEFPSPTVDQDGRLKLVMQASISLQGQVVASDAPSTALPAHITAWRDSLISGRPRVQTETATMTRAASGQKSDGFLFWLSRGHTYSFYVAPDEPYQAVYPPQLITGLKLQDHMKRDFVLEGKDRTVLVRGRLLGAGGQPLAHDADPTKIAANAGYASVGVRAQEESGLLMSTTAITDAKTGEFQFRVPPGGTVPTGGRLYTLKVESTSTGMLIPVMTCKDIFLGLYSGKDNSQNLGDLRLPSFSPAETFSQNIRGKDGSPVVGAVVKYSTSLGTVVQSGGFSTCTAAFERTAITNAEGKVSVQLLPGTSKNLIYSITITSPSGSPYASLWVPQEEVGKGGQMRDLWLEPRIRLRGKVLGTASEAVVGAVVEAQGIAIESAPSNFPQLKTTATTDVGGVFSLYLEPGSFNLIVRPPQGLGLPSFAITKKQIPSSLDGVVFQVPSPEAVAGMVVDSAGKALGSAKVEVYDLVNATDQTHRADLRASAVTGGTGRFLLLLPDH